MTTTAATCAIAFLFASAAHAQSCTERTVKFIVLDGDAELAAMEDDIRANLAVVGIIAEQSLLPKDDFNAAMTASDFNLYAPQLHSPTVLSDHDDASVRG